MKAIINFFKGLFGKRVVKVTPVTTPKPASQAKPTPKKPTGTGLPKSAEIKADIELSENPKPKKKRYYKPKPKQGGTSSGNGKQPYNTK